MATTTHDNKVRLQREYRLGHGWLLRAQNNKVKLQREYRPGHGWLLQTQNNKVKLQREYRLGHRWLLQHRIIRSGYKENIGQVIGGYYNTG